MKYLDDVNELYKDIIMKEIRINNMANFYEYAYFYKINTDGLSIDEVVSEICKVIDEWKEYE